MTDNQYASEPECAHAILAGGLLRVTFKGAWITERTLPHTNEIFRLLKTSAVQRLELHAESLGVWDSALLVLTTRLAIAAKHRHIPLDDSSLPEGVRRLTALALHVPPNKDAVRTKHKESMLEHIGSIVLTVPRMTHDILMFIGEMTLSWKRFLRGTSSCRWRDIWLHIQEGGAEALPIVSLISLLVGCILAFVGVMQLSLFGATIYVSSLVAVSMTRIMGAIMTGIIMAGRTGASYAATIGSMQVNEEIDALTTLGISPHDFLVLPRVIALTLMTPLLVLYADLMGIVGGFLVSVGLLGLNPLEYLTFTQKGFSLNNVWVGLVHGLVFGTLIALTGCYQGLRCGRSAAAVGNATTAAVVYAIVALVLATALLTCMFSVLHI